MAEHEQVNSKLITYEQLAENFHLPINEVSKKLGICTTVLKKVCRRNGIPRWPYRKLKAIDKKITNLKTSLQKNPQESKRIHAEILALQEQKRLIMENPSCLSTVEATEQVFDEAYDDMNSSALLLSLTPNREEETPQSPTPQKKSSPRRVTRLPLGAAGRTEEEEEELMVALNLVELMSSSSPQQQPAPQPPVVINNPFAPSQRMMTVDSLVSSPSSPADHVMVGPTPTLFTSSHPPFSTVPSFPSSSPPPSTVNFTTATTTRPNSSSPPPFPAMPMINPRSFFSAEERAPPIPHTNPTPPPHHVPLRSFSSAPFLEGREEPQPPLPSWFSRSLEEAVSPTPMTKSANNSRPGTPSGLKRAGRDVSTLEAESRTPKNPLLTKRSRNKSPNFQALGFPSLVAVAPVSSQP